MQCVQLHSVISWDPKINRNEQSISVMRNIAYGLFMQLNAKILLPLDGDQCMLGKYGVYL